MLAVAGGGGKNPKLVESVYSSCEKNSICPKYCLGTMAKYGWCADKLPQNVEFCEETCGLEHSGLHKIKNDILRHTGVCCYKEIHGVECPKCADGNCPCARNRYTADLQAIMVGICPDGESNYENTRIAREAYIAKEKAKLEKAKEKAANVAAEEQGLTEVLAQNEAAEEAAEAARRRAAVKERVAALMSGAESASVNKGVVEAPVAPAVTKTYAAALMSDVKPAIVDEVATEAPVASAEERKKKEYQRLEALTPKELSNYVKLVLTQGFVYAEERGWALIVDEGDK